MGPLLLLIVLVAACFSGSASAAEWRQAPVVPTIAGSVEATLKQELAANVAGGSHPNTFAKVGDSITESPAYLQGIACGDEHLGSHTELRSTIRYFHDRRFGGSATDVSCDYADSFSRISAAALISEQTAWATDPEAAVGRPCKRHESPLLCEYRLIRPAFALIMFGTNDSGYLDAGAYREDMTSIIEVSRKEGVIPILSTLPPRLDNRAANRRVLSYNSELYDLSERKDLPLINFWRALADSRMVHDGMAADGVHPNVSHDGPLEFSQKGLRYGYNQRNLITLETLRMLRLQLMR